jgi:hypothetical protein
MALYMELAYQEQRLENIAAGEKRAEAIRVEIARIRDAITRTTGSAPPESAPGEGDHVVVGRLVQSRPQ